MILSERMFHTQTFSMKIIHTVSELKATLNNYRTENKTVGLVPTMGALHEGHISLVNRSVEENDVTVVSIFVNPTQFNDKKDLDKYPRTLDADCVLLEASNAYFSRFFSEAFDSECRQ